MAQQPPLRDDTIVIRFAKGFVKDLARSAETCYRYREYYGLSFSGENDMTEDEVALQTNHKSGWMRTSTLGKLREAGFSLERSGRAPHLTLMFSGKPSEEELERLMGLFDEPKENPHPSN